jgi:ABC-type sugar transport system substrate-binding protein
LHDRRLVEQLPAAALGGGRPAEHRQVVEDAGGTYIDADANLSNEQQLTDISNLIAQGADVLILLAQDQNAVLPGSRRRRTTASR